LASLEEGQTLAASQIAEREGLSAQYASKIMHLFRKAGLVKAVRGMQGGFRLAKPAAEIPIKNVFESLRDEPTADAFCQQYRGQHHECVHMSDCSVRPVWQVLSGYFDNVLEKISLGDLRRTEEDTRKKVQVFAGAEAERIRQQFVRSK
jgi:Rrf2 family protein